MGKSDLTLGNESLRFRNVSEDVLASEKPPGGLEDACLRFPKRGVELPGGFRESVVYWYSFSNPRTRCIHCDNCLVIKKKCTLSYSLRSLRIYPPGC